MTSRQLSNLGSPTANAGANNNNSPLQSLTMLQQLSNAGTSQVAMGAELAAQQAETLALDNQKKQQNILAALQTQQQQVANAEQSLSSKFFLAGRSAT